MKRYYELNNPRLEDAIFIFCFLSLFLFTLWPYKVIEKKTYYILIKFNFKLIKADAIMIFLYARMNYKIRSRKF